MDIALLLATGAPLAFALSLPVLLVCSIGFSICGAFLISLLARDFRTANNLNGALILPAMMVTGLVLALVKSHALAALITSGVLATSGAVVLYVALKVVIFERLLR